MAKPAKRPPHRPPHVPTEQTRAMVRGMAGCGSVQEGIACVLGITVDTLVKYYRTDMDRAIVEANAKVAGSLYKNAVTHMSVSAQVAWLKMRAGWREPNIHELTGRDGEAIMLVTGVVRDSENQNETAPVRRIGVYDIDADAAD